MGFIGDLFSGESDFKAQSANVLMPTSVEQTQDALKESKSALDRQQAFVAQLSSMGYLQNQQNVFNQQQNLAKALEAQSQGQGPSIAQQQLAEATGQNVAQQAALLAGQRGGSGNVGLQARQIGQAGAQAQQQAAGQSALMRLQEQLAARQQLQQQQGMMAGLSTQQVGQQAQAMQAYGAQAQNEQQILLNALAQANQANVSNAQQMNSANAQTAAAARQAQGSVFGGLFNAAGAALPMFMGPAGGAAKGIAMAGNALPIDNIAYDGGVAKVVDGEPVVEGDSPKNDTVPAMLSPGEVVLPRTVVNAKNPGAEAKKFVDALHKQGKLKNGFYDGGVPAAPQQPAPLPMSAQPIINVNVGQPAPASQATDPRVQTEIEKLSKQLSGTNPSARAGESGFTPEQIQAEAQKRVKEQDEAAAATQARMQAELAQRAKMLQAYGATQDQIPQEALAAQAAMAPQDAGLAQKAPASVAAPAAEEPPAQAGAAPTAGVYDSLLKGIGQQEAGIKMQAEAQAKEAAAQEKALAAYGQNLEKSQADFQANMSALTERRMQMQKAIEEQKIDPGRYLGSLTGGQKILTTIGLLMSGLGAGMSGRENMAMKVIQDNIDRDIRAQEKELGKKESLLSQNMQEMGNLRDAYNMTRIMMNDMVSNEMRKAAAMAGSQKAKAAELMATGNLKAQNAQLLNQTALRQSLFQGAAKDLVSNPDRAARAINMLVDEKDRVAARKELGLANAFNSAIKGLDANAEKLKEISGVGAMTPFTKSKTDFESRRAEILQGIRTSMKGQGSLSDQEVVTAITPLLPNKTDTQAQIDKKVNAIRRTLYKMVASGETAGFPTLSGYGMKPPLSIFSNQKAQKAYEWAEQNPDRPEAKEVLMRLGMD